MKTTKFAATLLASLSLATAAAQETATVETAKPESPATVERQRQLQAETQAAAQAEARARALLEKKPVVYSGFLVDASRAEKKSKMFSLRQPRDPRTDYRNISFDERTAKPRGFVLFRMEF